MSNPSLPPGASSPRDHGSDSSRARSRDDAARENAEERADDRDRPSGGSSSSTMALIVHALTFLCCFNWIFGVLGMVLAIRAAHKRDRGRYLEAETLTRYSWYCLGAAGVMFAVMFILSFVVLTQAGSWVEGIVPVTNW
ncbi:hypothetical protein [Salinactinospora qingdaonensis]|uniref:DUF4190 domain-containing protein n=1 Tax=Salinactinospora qingdaonensis TaxID=702744 RepID=A0ABP7G949_9ACTN